MAVMDVVSSHEFTDGHLPYSILYTMPMREIGVRRFILRTFQILLHSYIRQISNSGRTARGKHPSESRSFVPSAACPTRSGQAPYVLNFRPECARP